MRLILAGCGCSEFFVHETGPRGTIARLFKSDDQNTATFRKRKLQHILIGRISGTISQKRSAQQFF